MAKKSKSSNDNALHEKLQMKGIDWNSLRSELESVLKAGKEVVIPLASDLLTLIQQYMPKQGAATPGKSCPADHDACCEATFCAALHTAYLAGSCCEQSEEE